MAAIEAGRLAPHQAWGELRTEPSGNYIAGNLRKIYDDSGSIFPESTYSGEGSRQERWKSVVKSDFTSIPDWRRYYRRGKKPMTSLPFTDFPGINPPKVRLPSHFFCQVTSFAYLFTQINRVVLKQHSATILLLPSNQ